jgi:hypothetical protein
MSSQVPTLNHMAKNPDFMLASITSHFATQVNAFRNDPSYGEDERSLLETIGRRIIGELAYAGLVVAAAVEAVVRGILTLIIFPIAIPVLCLFPSKTATDIVIFSTALGAISSLETSLQSLSFLVENVYKDKIKLADFACLGIFLCCDCDETSD